MLNVECWYPVWKYMELLPIKGEKVNENGHDDYVIDFFPT